MTFEQEQEILAKLREDKYYFGDFGRQFISNSDIHNLIKSPDKYGLPWDINADYLKGSYLHYRLLQPEIIDPMIVVDASTRGTNIYKEMVLEHTVEGEPKPMFLLQKEVDELDMIVKKVEGNNYFMEMLQGDRDPSGRDVEEPAIGVIQGKLFKGKADRLNYNKGKTIDLKSTRSLDGFAEFFKKYGYHGQAYIYRELFGLDVSFFVIEKDTGRLGVFEVSDETYEEGRKHVEKGLQIYDMYFGEDKTETFEQYFAFDIV